MRTRPRIRFYPRYPRRPYTTLYPLPYGVDYPGPRAVRQCVSRLVPEYRPSGTVIVPRMRCWWAWRCAELHITNATIRALARYPGESIVEVNHEEVFSPPARLLP